MFNMKRARREPFRGLNVAEILVEAFIRAVWDMPASVKLLRHTLSPFAFREQGATSHREQFGVAGDAKPWMIN
jgi:hypothetical protein